MSDKLAKLIYRRIWYGPVDIFKKDNIQKSQTRHNSNAAKADVPEVGQFGVAAWPEPLDEN